MKGSSESQTSTPQMMSASQILLAWRISSGNRNQNDTVPEWSYLLSSLGSSLLGVLVHDFLHTHWRHEKRAVVLCAEQLHAQISSRGIYQHVRAEPITAESANIRLTGATAGRRAIDVAKVT